jgi:hypothetical protein
MAADRPPPSSANARPNLLFDPWAKSAREPRGEAYGMAATSIRASIDAMDATAFAATGFVVAAAPQIYFRPRNTRKVSSRLWAAGARSRPQA